MTTDNRTNEPTEAMILAALNAYSSKGLEIDGYDPVEEYPSLEMCGDRFASQMRAALVAAHGATTDELAKIKPLFENLSREYPNECNKRVKAETERDAALAAVERVRVLAFDHGKGAEDLPVVRDALKAALDGAPELDRYDKCDAEVYSWDHYRPEQIDSYWIRCTLIGKHDEHEDSHTGLKWRSGLPVEGSES